MVAAIDVNHLAVEVYRRNFPHPAAVRTLESLTAGELAAFGADLWWLSPPCQPFTRRGLGRDLADPRTVSLLALIDRIGELPPPYLALENVPGFAGSATHERLRGVLEAAGYRSASACSAPPSWACPTAGGGSTCWRRGGGSRRGAKRPGRSRSPSARSLPTSTPSPHRS